MDTLQLFSSHISTNIMHTFLSSGFVFMSFYGLFLLCTNLIMTSIFTITILLTIVTGLVCYFKIPRTPQEQIDALFGLDPLRPKELNLNFDGDEKENINVNVNINVNCQGKSEPQVDASLLTNGVELLRNHEETTSRGLNGGKSNNPNPNPNSASSHSVLIIGHRGAGLDAPENSLSAFRLCKERGYPFVEFDVSLTKDSVPVIFHDDDLKRIAGIDTKINDMTWKELQEIDISLLHPLGEKFRHERIPSFDEAIKLLLELDMKFIIDLKDTNEHVIKAVCDAFAKYPQMYKSVVVSSFYAKAVYDIRRKDAKIIGCMAWRPESYRYKVWSVNSGVDKFGPRNEKRHDFFLYDWLSLFKDLFMDWALRNFLWWFLGLGAILLQKDCVSKHEIMNWTKNGVRVLLWTVNSPVEKLHLSQVVQIGYLTDTLDGNVLLHQA